MEKSYTGRYPELKDEQFDFTRAVVSMLNSRRYLESQGFDEAFANYDYYDTNSINGKVIFPEGSIIDNPNFISLKDTSQKDSLLERMIDKKAVFKRFGVNYFYERDKVIRTRFKTNEYDFKLSVIDTTREVAIIPVKWFLIKPRGFAFKYDILLNKGVITDSDLKDFEKHKQELKLAAKSNVILNYGSGSVTNGSNPAVNGIKSVEQVKPIEIFDPWKVEIKELENMVYGGRK